MKRLIIIIFTYMLTVTVMAQDYSLFEHYGNNDYYLQQCYDIIETTEGDFILKAAAFDGGLYDLHYNLYKITHEGVLLDSAYIQDPCISYLHPFVKAPDNPGHTIITSLFSDNGQCYYHATIIDDNLDVVSEIQTAIPIGFDYGDYSQHRFFVDSNNEISVYASVTDTSFVFFRIDLYGNLKYTSNPILKAGKKVVENPLFELSSNPLQYGLIRRDDNHWYIDILDSEYNILSSESYRRYNNLIFNTCPITNAVKIDDNHFVFSTKALDEHLEKRIVLVMVNRDLEIVSVYEFDKGHTTSSPIVNRGICTDGENLYFAYIHDNHKPQGRELVVNCLDRDLNLEWTRNCVNYNYVVNNAIRMRNNGGIMLAGFSYGTEQTYYENKHIYAIIFNNILSVNSSCETAPVLCHPNPAGSSLHLDISPDSVVESIILYDLSGRTIKTQSNSFENVDISGFAPGVYVMKVVLQNGKTYEEKIVKK